jgi:endonuclease/exonuclease/phosphatase family metal-dependent hydrolase
MVVQGFLAVVCLGAAVLVAGPAQAAPPVVRTMTFNICGAACRGGEVVRTAGNVAYQVRARRVHVALLQEVCYSQFLGIRSRLRGSGYTAAFLQTTVAGRCDDVDRRHSKAYGLAILAKGKLSGRVAKTLPSRWSVSRERRALFGGHVLVHGRPMFVATTHTAPSGPNLEAQMITAHRLLAPIARTRPVIFGGDFNMLPENPGLNRFYSAPAPGGTGSFREAAEGSGGSACRCGRATFDRGSRKIDYLFGNSRFFRPRSSSITGTPYSDHRMYVGDFTLVN